MKKHDKLGTKFRFKYFKLVLFLLIIFVTGALLATFFYYTYYIVDYREINTSVIISDRAGFNLDRDNLYFGKNYPSGSAMRSFTLTTKSPVIVKMRVSGIISNFLSFSDNNFLLNPEEQRKINLTLNVPLDAKQGNYSGTVKIYFYRTN